MKHINNPLDNHHDIENTLWHTEISRFNTIHNYDSDQFLLKFMKGRVSERKTKVKKFRKLFVDPFDRSIRWNIKEMIDSQILHDIWKAENEQR